jgi:hypothetical protein
MGSTSIILTRPTFTDVAIQSCHPLPTLAARQVCVQSACGIGCCPAVGAGSTLGGYCQRRPRQAQIEAGAVVRLPLLSVAAIARQTGCGFRREACIHDAQAPHLTSVRRQWCVVFLWFADCRLHITTPVHFFRCDARTFRGYALCTTHEIA